MKKVLLSLIPTILSFTMEPFYDQNNTRITPVQEESGSYTWLFFPGGAGADSNYLLTLLDGIQIPGSIYLIDFPGNGTNKPKFENFDLWKTFLIPLVEQFENPILVGHSYGGMAPFLHPELEKKLKGFVALGATPYYDGEEVKRMKKKRTCKT